MSARYSQNNFTSRLWFEQMFKSAEAESKNRYWARSGNEHLSYAKKSRELLRKLLALDRIPKGSGRCRVVSRKDKKDYVRHQMKLEVGSNIWMPFFMLVPKGGSQRKKRPAIICPHGHCGGGKMAVVGLEGVKGLKPIVKDINYNYGEHFARAGFIVFAPDARGFGKRLERRPNGKPYNDPYDKFFSCSCEYIQRMCLPLGLNITGLWVHDLICLMDHIVSRKDIDAYRVGCAGLSGGGLQTLYFSAADTRVAFACTSGYFYGALESLLQMPCCWCNYIPGMWEHFDHGDLGALIAPRPFVIETGDEDDLNGKSGLKNVKRQVEITGRAYRNLGAEKNFVHDIFHGPHRWNGKVSVPFLAKVSGLV